MQSPRSLARATGWVALSGALSSPAFGAKRACEGVMVSADPSVVARWPDLHERVQSGLTDRHDIDRCARVHLGPSDQGLTLRVTLQDGRSAQRQVPNSEDVVPALEPLLLLPSPELTTSRPAAPAPKPTVAKLPPVRKAVREQPLGTSNDQGAVSETTEAARSVGATLSLGGGGRMGDGQVSSNLGAMATLILSDWLMGFEGRAVSYESPRSAHIPQPALELTALGGHRFGSGTFGIDLVVGPTLVLQRDIAVHEEFNGRFNKTTTSRVLPRLFAASRLTIGARSVVGGFIGLEGAAGPSGASDIDAAAALPPLPVWMLGFVVGATVGVP